MSSLELYLIIINLLTLFGFVKNFIFSPDDEEAEEFPEWRIADEFETWLLDFLVLIGGGVGMFLVLAFFLQRPSARNGNWWSFCYASIMTWFTIYCFVCNPFGLEIQRIKWLSIKHLPILLYLIVINVITFFYIIRLGKSYLKEVDIRHTLVIILGFLGGTVGAIPAAIKVKRTTTYHYDRYGFLFYVGKPNHIRDIYAIYRSFLKKTFKKSGFFTPSF